MTRPLYTFLLLVPPSGSYILVNPIGRVGKNHLQYNPTKGNFPLSDKKRNKISPNLEAQDTAYPAVLHRPW